MESSMSNVKFSSLAIGQSFIYNSQEYVKTQEVRISCCKKANCRVQANSNNKKNYIAPGTLVQKKDNA